jgi:hypothetical protein
MSYIGTGDYSSQYGGAPIDTGDFSAGNPFSGDASYTPSGVEAGSQGAYAVIGPNGRMTYQFPGITTGPAGWAGAFFGQSLLGFPLWLWAVGVVAAIAIQKAR